MKLHRADTRPDWQLVPRTKQNPWQRLAAATHGVVTLGNITSLTGAALVVLGLHYVAAGQLWAGLVTLGIGRLLDILDGTLADITGTKSPLGESIDATFDKLAAFATIVVFITSDILPWPVAALLGVENAITALLSLAAKMLRRTIHPEPIGKIGGALEWVALIGFIFGAATHGSTTTTLSTTAYAVAAISFVLNGYATIRYAQMFRAQR